MMGADCILEQSIDFIAPAPTACSFLFELFDLLLQIRTMLCFQCPEDPRWLEQSAP